MIEGMIQKGALTQVIAEVIAGRKTGDLQCIRLHEEKHLYFRDGEIVFASTSVDSERIGQLMLKQGLVDPTMLEAVLKVVGPGRRTGRILVTEGVLTPEQLIRIVEAFIRRVACAVFSWKDGRVHFTEGGKPDIEDVSIEVPTADVILDAARHLPAATLASRAIGSLNEPLQFSVDPVLRFQKLHMSEEEAAIVSCVNNFTTAEEICSVSPLDRDATLRLLCGLVTSGIIEFPTPSTQAAAEVEEPVGAAAAPVDESEFSLPDDLFGEGVSADEPAVPAETPARARSVPPRTAPTPVRRPSTIPARSGLSRPSLIRQPISPRPTRVHQPPPPASTPPVDGAPQAEPSAQPVATSAPVSEPSRSSEMDQAERAQIQEVHRRLSIMDYYTLLELDRRSSDDEIRKAYFLLAKKYHPDRTSMPHLRDLKKPMEEIFAQVNRAYEVLRDPERRQMYDLKGAKPEAEEREGLGKETDEQIADRSFRMAKTLYDQRKYPEALQLLKQATRLNPTKGNYFFLMANTLVKSGSKREAEETYLKAIELDRFNSDIYVSLGLLYKASNMLKRAEGMFQRALQINDNHPVALRELAAIRPEEKGLLKSLLAKATDKAQRK